MGCGCNKKSDPNAQVARTNRNTVYQVIGADQTVIAEFSTLPEARKEAVAKKGRVRVTSKANN